MAHAGKHVVVVGAGIIGASTAFYLSNLGAKVTLVERHQVAGSASGKAGGFLALNWNEGPVGVLARRSFQLHADLSKTLPNCGYRKLHTIGIRAAADKPSGGKRKDGDEELLPAWLDKGAQEPHAMGTPENTAQVHPRLLTEALVAAAQQRGGTLLTDEVVGFVLEPLPGSNNPSQRVTGVRLKNTKEVLAADAVVLAMGPWARAACAWGLPLPTAVFGGLKAHSIVLRATDLAITPHAVFIDFKTKTGKMIDPEIYPRNDGTVYLCGVTQDALPPDDPAAVQADAGAGETLLSVAATVSSHLTPDRHQVTQACYLPLSSDNLPMIGPVPTIADLYIANAHSCWGILNGPATGEALAELILTGASKHVNLAPFSPARFLHAK
jgi:glycine/D-amino acid oxidase-like deaminating enzyme